MGLAYIRHLQQDNYMELVEIITLSPGSPPPRPHPEPPLVDPDYGIDVDTGVPPHPTHPIALPGDPWWGTGGKPPTPGEPPKGTIAVIAPLPPGATPPTAPPPDATVMVIKMNKDAMPTYAWIAPYAQQLPGSGTKPAPAPGTPPPAAPK